MKVAALILAMFLAAVSAAGQFVSNNIDIPESQYLAAEKKAEKLLKTVNYRCEIKRDLLVSMYPPIIPQAHIIVESVSGKAFREVVATFGEEKVRSERIEIGNKVYTKRNDEQWKIESETSPTLVAESAGEAKSQFKYLGFVTYEGQETEFYSSISDVKAEILSGTKKEELRVIQTSRIWYLRYGRILRKSVESEFIGRNMTMREVTAYEYDPKDLKIEAPIK